MKSKFDQTFDKIINEFSLIMEDYNILPVPKILINDMVEFCLNNTNKENQDEKEYNKHLADVKEGDFLIMHIGIVKVEHIAIKPRLRIIVKGT